MLYVNNSNLSLFSVWSNIKVDVNGYFSSTYANTNNYARFDFPQHETEVWALATMWVQPGGETGLIGIGVDFGNGKTGKISFDNNMLKRQYLNNSLVSTATANLSSGMSGGKSYKIRLHVWINPDNNKQVCVEVYIGDKKLHNGYYYNTSSSAVLGFTNFIISGSGQINGWANFKNIIVSDKEITAGTSAIEIPITEVEGWIKNSNGSFSASELDKEGTLIPDEISLDKASEYNIQGSIILGKYLRDGDNIKNLHIKANGKEIDFPLEANSSSSVFTQELGITNATALSSIVISPKG